MNETCQVGPYTLVRRLGVGGMGEVWAGRRSHETGACKTVAVKLLTPERTHDEISRRMFDDEARLSMLLGNSNIVQVFDVGEDAGVRYMAMEWVDGRNLDELSGALRERGETLTLSVVGYVVGEILKALAYAHEFEHEGCQRTIVHRDVSAQNVMLSVAGEVKLMDFGIARVASEETSGIHVKGKLRYMPPEQLRGDTRAPTIDLFAVGAILHELLDGRRFRSGVVDEARLYGMVLDGEIPPLTCPPGRLPSELEALRSGLLKADVDERIQSAREAHGYLAAWPGYRDAKFELQDLVRQFTTPASSSKEMVTLSHISHTHPHSSRSNPHNLPTAPLAPRGSSRFPSASATTEHSVLAQVLSPPESSIRASSSFALRIALPLTGLMMFGISLVSFALHGDSPDAEDPPERAPSAAPEQRAARNSNEEEDSPLSGTAETQPRPHPPEAPPSTPTQPLAPSSPPKPRDAPSAIEPDAPDEPDAAVPQPPARVTVEISAPTVFWIEIEIGGRVYSLDRMGGKTQARARLRPGTYRARYRDSARGAWKSGGTVTIPETKGTLRLTLQQSGHLKLE
ncbi:serine/threonine-protein kinase [Enhygromyxa salina]|uniref:serine/threonine-protein kinase n=1 Tax=Enhygromyxa salina TaxID=215803 RepID=UPI0015E6AD63|nr:serine/threonine-protein kinase [Enhygromyxa salina]